MEVKPRSDGPGETRAGGARGPARWPAIAAAVAAAVAVRAVQRRRWAG